MKFDTAYSLSLDEKLSIYDVRDLNFDETAAFDSNKEHLLCPNDQCRAAFDTGNTLGTFNAKNVNYLRTPHFKNKVSTRHIDGCRYASTHKTATDERDDEREEHFPSEWVLTRRQYERKTPLTVNEGNIARDPEKAPSSRTDAALGASDTSPDKTSVFAHPVECYVSNIDDKDKLKSMPLKIGDHTASYWTFFKKIEYLQDSKGLIYWVRSRRSRTTPAAFASTSKRRCGSTRSPTRSTFI